jgi:hypothetical protein
MLPDLPSLKRDIQRVLTNYLKAQINARLGVFGETPMTVVHEGNRMRIIRADGSIEDQDFKASSAEMHLQVDEIPRLTLEQRITKLNDLADQMARQRSEHLIASLNATLEKAGQVVNQQGKPLDAEAVFAVLEKMQRDFDETGKIDNLSIVVSPMLEPKAKQVFEQIMSDPILQKRHKEIIERKWSEWRDREAARKLVG